MIRSFKHKGLRDLAETGRSAKLGMMATRAQRILRALNAATQPQHMDLPGFKFHARRGDQKGRFSVWVTANYRITFGWQDDYATDVDLEDYH